MNIIISLKSRSFILDLDHVKFFFGIFFFTGLFIGDHITPAFRIYLFCVKNAHQKAANLIPNFTCGNGSLMVPRSAIYANISQHTHTLVSTLALIENSY